MKFAIITTCMGRADHLAVSLPKMLAQLHVDHDVVVVDWSSPDDVGSVINANRADNLYHFFQSGQEYFHLAAARNVGAQYAVDYLKPDWLVFLDADILIPPTFLDANEHLIGCANTVGVEKQFRQTERTGDGDVQVWGSCFVRAEDWDKVRYNEAITGYGFEDNDYYERLEAAGVERCRVDMEGVAAIPHSEELRFANYPEEYVDGKDYGRDRC